MLNNGSENTPIHVDSSSKSSKILTLYIPGDQRTKKYFFPGKNVEEKVKKGICDPKVVKSILMIFHNVADFFFDRWLKNLPI